MLIVVELDYSPMSVPPPLERKKRTMEMVSMYSQHVWNLTLFLR